MARVSWSDRAIINLQEIFDYLALHNPAAASRIRADLISAAQGLEIFPNRGRSAFDGTRELVNVWPYLICYDVHEDEVRIVYVRHGAQLPDRLA